MTEEQLRSLDVLVIVQDMHDTNQMALAIATFNQAVKLGLSAATALRDGREIIILQQT